MHQLKNQQGKKKKLSLSPGLQKGTTKDYKIY